MSALFSPLAPKDAHTDFHILSFTFSCNVAFSQLRPLFVQTHDVFFLPYITWDESSLSQMFSGVLKYLVIKHNILLPPPPPKKTWEKQKSRFMAEEDFLGVFWSSRWTLFRQF